MLFYITNIKSNFNRIAIYRYSSSAGVMQRNADRRVFMSAIVYAISLVLGDVISIEKHILLTNTHIYKHIKTHFITKTHKCKVNKFIP